MALPWTDKDRAFWKHELTQARQKRQDIADQFDWDGNLKRYIPKPPKKVTDGTMYDQVNIGADFRDVERKKAALFYDMPDIALAVTQDRELPPIPELPLQAPLSLSTLAQWQQEILNTLLGPEFANAKPTILEAIFDCLCPAGVGPVSVGYQVTMQTVEQQVPVLDPVTQQPVMKPVPAMQQVGAALGVLPPPMPEPLMQTVPVEVPIHERWFISRLSPKALLIPSTWMSTQHNRAPWRGHDWRKPTSQVIREYQLPPDWKAGLADDQTKPYFERPDQQPQDDDAGDPYVSGATIYYRAQLRSEQEEHPDALMELVLVDGVEDPIVHRVSPHQDFDPKTGEMTPDSLRTFPEFSLILRDLSDSAWVPSDCSVTGALTRELEKFREQSIRQRDNNHNVILFDSKAIDPTAKDKIIKGPGGSWVPVEGDALARGKDAVMAQAAQVTLGRENFIAQDYIEKDREQILGIAANQSGVQSRTARTATENSIVQRNSEARFEQERQRVLAWLIDIVSAFDTLILRYGDERIASQILGEQRGKVWATYKSALAGGYTYGLKVDSGKYLDIEADRRQWLQVYNMMRRDPMVNPRPIVKKLAEVWGMDPAELIAEPQPKQQELKASVVIKGELLDPTLPQFPIYIALLRQGGWKIDEQSVQLAQQQAQAHTQGMLPIAGVGPDLSNPAPHDEHPGAQPTQPTLNKHQMDESGQRSGPKVL